MRRIWVLFALVALSSTGCGDSGGEPGGTDNPSVDSAPTKSAEQKAVVTGFGATKTAWLSAHTQVDGFEAGFAFEPLVATYESDEWPMYGGVLLETPVISYSINLPKDTSLSQAKEAALAEFPSGADFVRFDDGEKTCLLASIRSAPVKRSLAKHGFGGVVFGAAFVTHTQDTAALDPTRVTQVIMTTLYPESPNDLGRC